MLLTEKSLESFYGALLNKLKESNIPNGLASAENHLELIKIFHEQFKTQEIVAKKFPHFEDFIDEALFWSYDLKLNRPALEKGRFVFDKCQKEENQFTGKIDLFCLVDFLLKSYPSKNEGYDNFSLEKRIDCQGKKIVLESGFLAYLEKLPDSMLKLNRLRALFDNMIRITGINGYQTDYGPVGSHLVVHHRNEVGAIGKIGTAIGDVGINIAYVKNVSRGGNALTLVTTDRTVKGEVIDKITGELDPHYIRQFRVD